MLLSFLHIPLKCFTVPHLSFDIVFDLGFDIVFLYSQTTLEISSRTNILFQVVLAGNQIDNVITITMKDPLV